MSKPKNPPAEAAAIELPAEINKPVEEMTTEELQRATAVLQFVAAKAAYAATVTQQPQAQAAGGEDADLVELRTIQLETARLGLDAARDANVKTKETKAERIARRLAALSNMRKEEETKQRIRRACRHHVGGKGLADMLRGGKDGTSIIKSALPIAGMVLYVCTRCGDESITPSPMLQLENPEAYAKAVARHEKFEEMFAESYNAVEMGGPQFAFTQNGMPIHPDMIPEGALV